MNQAAFDIDQGLPEFLDPVFDWLATKLPPQVVDSVVVPGVTHLLSFGYSLVDVGRYLISSHPLSWDPAKILPPLITLLGAYLALLSFYRTTSWMIRTTMWFAKWGSLFAALVGGAGYLAGARGEGNGGGGGGIADMLNFAGGATGVAKAAAGMLWDTINSPGNEQNSRRRPRTRSQTQSSSNRRTGASQANTDSKTRAGKAKQGKPKAWDTFGSRAPDAERAHEDDADVGNVDAKKIMSQIVGFADKMGWMGAAREFLGGQGSDDDDEESASGKGTKKGSKVR